MFPKYNIKHYSPCDLSGQYTLYALQEEMAICVKYVTKVSIVTSSFYLHVYCSLTYQKELFYVRMGTMPLDRNYTLLLFCKQA